jgi:predicted AAA+ superfamily ATPase
MIKSYIKRQKYLLKIKPYIDKDIIKVIVGQRRVGKSYLLFQAMDELLENGVKESDIIYINKELFEFDEIKNYRDLLKFIQKETKGKRKKYLFIDEIQDVEQFEKALRHLSAKGGYDIYCTGSNANLLSGELATFLSGRYIEIEIFGLSYLEFLKFHKLENNQDSLLKYIKYGGLPYLVNLELSDDVVFDYTKNIYNTILLKDVVSRHKIRNVAFLERLVEYLADNTGSLVSAKKISDFLKSQRTNISPNIVLDYLSFLSSSFLIFKAKRSEVQGKKIFEINEKYYFEDLGIRNSIVAYKQADINKILENLVFMHFKSSGYNVMVGQLGKKEIDFVADKNGEKIYAQVVYLLASDEVREREFGNLLAIPDNYPKMVISMDKLTNGKYKGIEHLHIIDFLSREL